MTAEVAPETIAAISDAAERMKNVGVREFSEELRDGFELSTDEVFALLHHEGLAGVREQLEAKYGSYAFDKARGGEVHDLGELLIGDRAEIRDVARRLTR